MMFLSLFKFFFFSSVSNNCLQLSMDLKMNMFGTMVFFMSFLIFLGLVGVFISMIVYIVFWIGFTVTMVYQSNNLSEFISNMYLSKLNFIFYFSSILIIFYKCWMLATFFISILLMWIFMVLFIRWVNMELMSRWYVVSMFFSLNGIIL